MEFDASKHLDDLKVALVLLQNISNLYLRLGKTQKNNLLRIVVKRIIINREGEIVSHELHSPFSYLSTLDARKNGKNEVGWRSESIHEGVHKPPENDLERFVSMLTFTTQSLIIGDRHNMVDDNGIIFDDNVVHQ